MLSPVCHVNKFSNRNVCWKLCVPHCPLTQQSCKTILLLKYFIILDEFHSKDALQFNKNLSNISFNGDGWLATFAFYYIYCAFVPFENIHVVCRFGFGCHHRSNKILLGESEKEVLYGSFVLSLPLFLLSAAENVFNFWGKNLFLIFKTI